MKLKNASIIGFFSMPPPSLAEQNPTAYSTAISNLPPGAGTCSHCGRGIVHHVIIRDQLGVQRFIGADCAEKVGVSSECIRYKMTSEQMAARDAKRAEAIKEYQRKEQERAGAEAARIAARREKVGDLVDMLRSLGGDFYNSLASQLENRPLSWRQAEYVAKATSDTGRRNKRNADAYDLVIDRCMEETEIK